MVIATHLSVASRRAAPVARGSLFALLLLAIPATAWADIFKWTDEKGRTVLSNVAPAKSATAKNFEMIAKETPPANRAPASVPPHVATPTEQALLARIESLERQLQATQYAAQQAAAMPAPAYYNDYYPPAPPPPSYYPGGYYGGYYPGYYPTYYYPAARYAVYPVRGFVGRPVHVAPHGGSFHGGGSHGGGSGRGGGGHRGRR